jgi:carbonic anhydrase/acetyltransferase-like protein (isoleucine patch superfamily)
MSLYPKT